MLYGKVRELTQKEKTNRERAAKKWDNSVELFEGDYQKLGLSYFKNRGLDGLKPTPSLKLCLPALSSASERRYPSIVARVTCGSEFYGVHQIFIDAGKKAPIEIPKMSLGPIGGGAVYLDDPVDGVLAVGEGIETMLAVRAATGLPCWATLTAIGLEKVFIPPNIRALHVFADLDRSGVGKAAAIKLSERLISDVPDAEGVRVFIHLPSGPIPDSDEIKGVDWLDVYATRGSAEFDKALGSAVPFAANGSDLDRRPTIVLNGTQESELLSKIHITLLDKNSADPKIFRRGSKLVTLVSQDDRMLFKELNYEPFKFKIINLAEWKHLDSDGEERAAQVPERIVKQLFGNPPEQLETLDGIIRTPFFTSSGAIIHRSGYCRDQSVYLDTRIAVSKTLLKNEITPTELLRSKSLLLDDFLGEFSFKDNSDRTHYISALLHWIVRRMFRGPTPFMFIDASAPRSGKTLLAEMLAIIQTGDVAPGVVLSTDEAEQRKAITGLFRSGAEIFFFDNVKTGIDSSVLAKAATQDVWVDRVLGGNEIYTAKNDVPWIFTINGFSATGEIVRRSPRIRIIHQSRTKFKRDAHQLKEWVRAHRSDLVEALCVIVQNWVNHGRPLPKHGRQLPSFEAWSNLMGGVFETSDIPGFLENGEEHSFAADDETAFISAIFNSWSCAFGETYVRPSELISNQEICSLFVEMLGNSNPHALPGAVGIRLKSWVDRVAVGYQLRLPRDGGPKRGRVYQLVRTGEGGGGATFKDSLKN